MTGQSGPAMSSKSRRLLAGARGQIGMVQPDDNCHDSATYLKSRFEARNSFDSHGARVFPRRH